MYGKIQISGKIEVKTGMHIGGSSAFAAIGAVDSPVIRDASTNLPMIPGSSLKGKMRSLLAREFNKELVKEYDNDNDRITRLFGSAKKGAVKVSRILISDMALANEEELRRQGLQSVTEVKFENSINRATCRATPRQIERVVKGSVFDLDIMYEVVDEKQITEDFEMIAEGMKLLQYDYIGGSGSRGYGKVKFSDLRADVVIGNLSNEVEDKCTKILNDAVIN